MPSAKECVVHWNEAFGRGDRDAMNALLHEEYRLNEPIGTPYPGVFKGPEGWWAFFDNLLATWRDLGIANHRIFLGDSPDECTIMMDLTGTSIATGEPMSTSLIEHWRFKDGKILEMNPHYCDTYYLRQVCGML